MRSTRVWGSLAALLMLLPAAARCDINIFDAPLSLETKAAAARASGAHQKVGRLHIGAFLTLWDFASFSVQGGSRAQVEADAGPLVTADYFLSPRFSVGGWWNRFTGELTATDIPGGASFKLADAVANFWDVHGTYYLPDRVARGVSVQVGFSRLQYDIDFLLPELPDGRQNFNSLNLWINKTQQVGSRRIRGSTHPIHIYGSLGYHTSAQFERAWNVIAGASFPLTDRLNLSSSVWLHDLDNINTRLTVGLTGTF